MIDPLILEHQNLQLRERLSEYGTSGAAPLRLVYIPTHREFSEVLHAVSEEISVARHHSSDEFQLLLIDDRGAEIAEHNRQSAMRTANNCDFPVNWLSVEAWREFVDALLKDASFARSAKMAVRDALLKPSGSYAGGMNKAALFAAYLGANTLHRRDSDEFPAYDVETGMTTLEVEIAALSVEIRTGVERRLDVPYFVGSSVEGEPTLDHRDLNSVGEDFVRDLGAISGRSRRSETKQDPVARIISVRPRLPLQLEEDTSGRTQVGVSASREVFRWIPEMPAVGILGTDHFQKGLLYRLGFPVYWHPMSANHKYEPWRADQSDTRQLKRYAVSELRYAILRHYWNRANETLSAVGCELFSDSGEFLPDVYADAFVNALEPDIDEAQLVADGFVDVYSRAAQLAAGSVGERLHVRVDALREERPRVVGYVRDAILEFAQLTRSWTRLVAAAEAMSRNSIRRTHGE
ncbi:DUF6271 family protein [Nocardia gipuzkoensis]